MLCIGALCSQLRIVYVQIMSMNESSSHKGCTWSLVATHQLQIICQTHFPFIALTNTWGWKPPDAFLLLSLFLNKHNASLCPAKLKKKSFIIHLLCCLQATQRFCSVILSGLSHRDTHGNLRWNLISEYSWGYRASSTKLLPTADLSDFSTAYSFICIWRTKVCIITRYIW